MIPSAAKSLISGQSAPRLTTEQEGSNKEENEDENEDGKKEGDEESQEEGEEDSEEESGEEGEVESEQDHVNGELKARSRKWIFSAFDQEPSVNGVDSE